MTALRDRICSAPLTFDPDRATSVIQRLSGDLTTGPLGDLLAGAAGSSPFLARLIVRHSTWLEDVSAKAPEDALFALLQDIEAASTSEASRDSLSSALRAAKSRTSLLVALADLGGVWQLEQVTDALSQLADVAVGCASRWLLHQELAAGRLPGLEPDSLSHGAGYVVLAMGKWGAHELNYSSDIDAIVLFDDALFDNSNIVAARARYIHVTRQLVQLIGENTGEGYVFRTDLRLRPTPSTTPVCLSLAAAERYYEAAGRTWERAAHIKARPLVDHVAGTKYLERLNPFVWRRHLDFASIEDVHSLLRKIRLQQATAPKFGVAGVDLKRGQGGIREIEFFAQTRQLIMGGRDPALRLSTTVGALDALAGAGLIEEDIRDQLSEDYRELRMLEHRLQMIEDAQTHTLPKSREARARVAALAGQDDLDSFDSNVSRLMERVHRATEEFFGHRAPPVQAVEPTGTEDTFLKRGFNRPGDALRTVRRWQNGWITATRSDRAQGLISDLEGQIVQRLAGAADPDRALVQFDRFLTGLPAGVQVFSLFTANPKLLDLIVEICSAAPRLASYLSRHPQTLDALLDRDFWQTLPDQDLLAADLTMRLAGIKDYEQVLDATRRWARERWFQVGVQVLRNLASPAEACASFSRVAETFINGLLPHVIGDFQKRHGAPPGNGLAVLAFGKLGSKEMTAGSDLDLIIIFDADDVDASVGEKPLASAVYYRRLTQALIMALTAQTAEGAVYEVDMRLRPSGRAGPVAVSLNAFERYQMNEAWVWEHLALTRARPVAGSPGLCKQIAASAATALAKRRGQEEVLIQAREMRARLVEANRLDRDDQWSLKHAAGGLMEIEFFSQVGSLLTGLPSAQPLLPTLQKLAEIAWLTEEEARQLIKAAKLQQAMQQIERVALEVKLNPEAIGEELRQVFNRATGTDHWSELSEHLKIAQTHAAGIIAKHLA